MAFGTRKVHDTDHKRRKESVGGRPTRGKKGDKRVRGYLKPPVWVRVNKIRGGESINTKNAKEPTKKGLKSGTGKKCSGENISSRRCGSKIIGKVRNGTKKIAEETPFFSKRHRKESPDFCNLIQTQSGMLGTKRAGLLRKLHGGRRKKKVIAGGAENVG